MRAKWGPLSSSGREGGAEAEEEGEEEKAANQRTIPHIPPHSVTWDNTLRREWQCEFWGRSVRSGHPEESAQTDSDI